MCVYRCILACIWSRSTSAIVFGLSGHRCPNLATVYNASSFTMPKINNEIYGQDDWIIGQLWHTGAGGCAEKVYCRLGIYWMACFTG